LFVNANIFGQLAVLAAAINKKSTFHQMKVDTANEVMMIIGLNEDNQELIREHFLKT